MEIYWRDFPDPGVEVVHTASEYSMFVQVSKSFRNLSALASFSKLIQITILVFAQAKKKKTTPTLVASLRCSLASRIKTLSIQPE